MARIARLTSWDVVCSGQLGMWLLTFFTLSIITSLIACGMPLVYILLQANDKRILCISTAAYTWLTLSIIFACFLIFIVIPLLCCICSEEDYIISKRTCGSVVLFIMAISICLFSMIFVPFSDRDVLMFRTDDTNESAFQLEFSGGVEHISILFLNFTNQSFPDEFNGPNCTLFGVHDLCPTWGPLLYMNTTEFFRCPLDSNLTFVWNNVFDYWNFSQYKDKIRSDYFFFPFNGLSVCLIISIAVFVSSLLMMEYRRFISSDQWFDTRLENFVERHRSSVLDLLVSLVTDFLPIFLKSLFDDLLSIRETVE
jgi:hypothetical protein